MKPVYYLLIFDAIVIIIMIKIIFGSYKVFMKSLAHHIFPDDVLPNPLEAFAEQKDSRHKINLLYAVILTLGVITALFFILPDLRNL